jgi:ABC-type nickel/cobalt efflux system permease component RcnA
LGNTSVNIYERIEVGAQAINVRFVLDIAEFPALREKEFADTDDDGAISQSEATAYLNGFWDYLAPRLTLTISDRAVPLTRSRQELTFPPGQGGLQLMRAVIDLSGPQPTLSEGELVTATLTETTFEGVPGWHEIVVRAGAGTALIESDVPDVDVTNELTFYPPDMVDTPLSVRQANFSYRIIEPSGSDPVSSSPPASTPPTIEPGGPRPTDPMVALLGQRLDFFSAVLGLGLAALLGAVHAVTPGHGKTLVAAYLVGSRANVRHGLWLGATVALTHTAGIFVLGLATLAFAELVVPERIVGWLSVITGALIVALGFFFIWRSQQLKLAIEGSRSSAEHSSKGAGSSSGHVHAVRGHRHSHVGTDPADPAQHITPPLQRRDIAVLGVVGGLVPSGSALILLLSAVALNELLYGLLLIVAFGLGMAVVLVGISTVIVLLRHSPVMAWERWRDPRMRVVANWLPTISGVIVVALGLFLTLDALRALR